jgi:ribonuclease D
MDLPRWIKTPEELAALAGALEGAATVAIDTEADSLHHYPGKLCLVQVASDRGQAHLIDPLALPSLLALGPLCADPTTVKVLHAAENDLAYLKRLYGFSFVSLFDTALAARLLGVAALSLDGLLAQFLELTPVKSRQKDDWSRRPLTAEQEAYALNDVLHLGDLRARLIDELVAKGRLEWVEEECAAVAASSLPEKVIDPDAYLKLKGAKDLDQRGWGVLRELHQMREAMALRLDRPPFMIVGNESLVALAAKRPRTTEDVLAVPGCSQSVVRRAGAAILDAVARGESLAADELPVRRPAPRPVFSAAVRRRAEALRVWRAKAAQDIALDPGVLFPQRVIDRLAADPPRDLAGLEQVEGVRRWRTKLFGGDLLAVLASA